MMGLSCWVLNECYASVFVLDVEISCRGTAGISWIIEEAHMTVDDWYTGSTLLFSSGHQHCNRFVSSCWESKHATAGGFPDGAALSGRRTHPKNQYCLAPTSQITEIFGFQTTQHGSLEKLLTFLSPFIFLISVILVFLIYCSFILKLI
jgi:hypothetical protein